MVTHIWNVWFPKPERSENGRDSQEKGFFLNIWKIQWLITSIASGYSMLWETSGALKARLNSFSDQVAQGNSYATLISALIFKWNPHSPLPLRDKFYFVFSLYSLLHSIYYLDNSECTYAFAWVRNLEDTGASLHAAPLHHALHDCRHGLF